MNEIIKTIEKAIKAEQWSIDYHRNGLEAAEKKKIALAVELAELKEKFGIVDEEKKQAF